MKTALAIALLGVLFGLPLIGLVTSSWYAVKHWRDPPAPWEGDV